MTSLALLATLGLLQGTSAANSAPAELSRATLSAFQRELAFFNAERPANENLVFSPAGIELCATAVVLAAGGKTQADLLECFAVPGVTATGLASDFRNALASYQGSEEVGMFFSFWTYQARPEAAFQNELRTQLNSELFQISDPLKVHEQANSWVKEATKGRIPQILEPQSKSFRFLALSANTFDGAWPTPLTLIPAKGEEAIRFQPEKGEAGPVETLKSKALSLGPGQDFETVTLSYRSSIGPSRYRFLLLVPNSGKSVKSIVDALDPYRLRENLKGRGGELVYVKFPKFKIASDPPFEQYMKSTPAASTFKANADFRRIAPGIFLGRAIHRAMIEVDEVGTKAAAATAITGRLGAPPRNPNRTIVADRPFVFMIYDTKTDLPLFAGVVANP